MRAIQLVPNFSCPWLKNLAMKKCGKLNFVIQALGYFGPVIKTSIKTGHWHLKTVSAVAKKSWTAKIYRQCAGAGNDYIWGSIFVLVV